jgi:hypothetical protein
MAVCVPNDATSPPGVVKGKGAVAVAATGGGVEALNVQAVRLRNSTITTSKAIFESIFISWSPSNGLAN